MKKLMMSCAVALLSLAAFSANAGQQAPEQNCVNGQTECVTGGDCTCQTPCNKECKDANKKCKKADKKKGKKGHKDSKGKKGQKGHQCCAAKKGNPAFKGIELTPEQQSKIETLNAKRKAAVDKSREELKKAIAKDREAYDKEVKEILTPEQRATYDKNVAEIKARRAERELKRDGKYVIKEAKKDLKKGEKAIQNL